MKNESRKPALVGKNNGKHWEQLVSLPPIPQPRGYMLCRTQNAQGKSFYVWQGNNGCYYSPVFTNEADAVRFPDQNVFKEISAERLAEMVTEEGLTP